MAARSDPWVPRRSSRETRGRARGDATERQREVDEAYAEAAYQRTVRPETATIRVLEAADETDAIVERSAYYGLTVVGARQPGFLPLTATTRRRRFG